MITIKQGDRVKHRVDQHGYNWEYIVAKFILREKVYYALISLTDGDMWNKSIPLKKKDFDYIWEVDLQELIGKDEDITEWMVIR
jgi:hypothetical protein